MKSGACRHEKHSMCKSKVWDLDTETFLPCECDCHVDNPNQTTLL
jgi:hypothetical protein